MDATQRQTTGIGPVLFPYYRVLSLAVATRRDCARVCAIAVECLGELGNNGTGSLSGTSSRYGV